MEEEGIVFRNRTKKEQALIDEVTGIVLIGAALLGWYVTDSLGGALIAVGIAVVLVIVISVFRSMRLSKRLKQSGIADIDEMSGRQFEEYLGTLFNSQGYNVSYTPATGDFGADLILKKGKEIVVVQAKRYKKSVGIKAVQEVIPAKTMYNATAAWVVTNSNYTKQALTLGKRNGVRMIDREQLIRLSIDMKTANEKTKSVASR
jgi:restriction system protein